MSCTRLRYTCPYPPNPSPGGRGPKLPNEDPNDSNFGPGGSLGPGSRSGYARVSLHSSTVRCSLLTTPVVSMGMVRVTFDPS